MNGGTAVYGNTERNITQCGGTITSPRWLPFCYGSHNVSGPLASAIGTSGVDLSYVSCGVRIPNESSAMTFTESRLSRVSPLVSILIPAYNHERFVTECLDSAVTEPYPNKEILIIDDGSKDSTPELISEWVSRHRINLPISYKSRPNRGISATMNEMASEARGEFLRLGASDDLFLAGGIRAQVDYLLDHPNKLAVIADAVVIDANSVKTADSALVALFRANKRKYLTDAGIRREIISRWAVGGPTPMLRRSALRAINGWSEDLRVEDWSFFLRLAARNAIGFIDVPVGAYRLHSENMSKIQSAEQRIANLNDFAITAERHLEDFAEPYRTFLRSQRHLVAAKIAYLQQRPIGILKQMSLYSINEVIARVRLGVTRE